MAALDPGEFLSRTGDSNRPQARHRHPEDRPYVSTTDQTAFRVRSQHKGGSGQVDARRRPVVAGVARAAPAVPITVLSRRNRVRRKMRCWDLCYCTGLHYLQEIGLENEGWLATRSSRRNAGERRVVDQIFNSSNQLFSRLRQVGALRSGRLGSSPIGEPIPRKHHHYEFARSLLHPEVDRRWTVGRRRRQLHARRGRFDSCATYHLFIQHSRTAPSS